MLNSLSLQREDGSSSLPRNHRGTVYEKAGLRIRDSAGLSPDEPLDPYVLAKAAGIQVIHPRELVGLDPRLLERLCSTFSAEWSGATTELPDDRRVCILNPEQTRERASATLMEEIVHVRLEHAPTKIVIGSGLSFREYNHLNEEVAYGVGAAALVPYVTLHRRLRRGSSPEAIAEHFGVSLQLVIYRIKITMLWELYRRKAS
jgi:IrrE N-terminal-like domain